MTPNEINAAVARTVMNPKHLCGCGLHWIQSDRKSCGNPISNYHGSLDAIVPVVRALNLREQDEIMSLLCEHGSGFVAVSTPAQWCEAYLKAKGLLT